jgi:AmiR/NasT family two-component response regulator
LPVVVATQKGHAEGMTPFLNCADAGAFSVISDESDLIEVRCAFTVAAQRGAALRDALKRVDQLEQNLVNRRVVEQAKWMMVQRDSMTEPDAHLALQHAARSTRTPLIDIAQAVIDGAPLPE